MTLRGPQFKVVLNDHLVQDPRLDDRLETMLGHDGSQAPPLKDRPRRGHIGFYELIRDDD